MEVIDTEIKEFLQNNDVLRKIEAALENIRVGQGGDVFEGLQNGKCTVDLTFNGEYIYITQHAETVTVEVRGAVPLEPHLEPLEEIKAPEVANATEETPIDASEEPISKDASEEPISKKRRRGTS